MSLLVWAASLAAVAGAVATVRSLPFGFQPGTEHPGWVARYSEADPSLAGESRALFVADDPEGTPKYKLFRAQFVLSPTVLQDRSSLEKVRPHHLLVTPLLLDASSAQSLEAMIEQLQRAAATGRVEVVVERLPRRLAVVRARRGEP